VVVSAGAPIVLSVWRGDPGAPTVVFLSSTMTHPLFYAEFLDGLNRCGLAVVGVHYRSVHTLGPGSPPPSPLHPTVLRASSFGMAVQA
jgi:hypothetical protein